VALRKRVSWHTKCGHQLASSDLTLPALAVELWAKVGDGMKG
jgi:hypothetical protein